MRVHGVAMILVLGAMVAACTFHTAAYEAEWVDQAPPTPRIEPIPPAPFDDGVWLPGHWDWTGAAWFWVPGHWMHRPRPGLRWYPGGWVRRGKRYVRVPGRWARPGVRRQYRYVHPRRRAIDAKDRRSRTRAPRARPTPRERPRGRR
jgi:hypothetical protein